MRRLRRSAVLAILIAAGLAAQDSPRVTLWSNTGRMTSLRYNHTSTLMPNGKVLVIGGGGGANSPGTAEIFEPATNSWRATAPPINPPSGHSAILLANGKIFVTGVDSAELFDPQTETW